MIGSEGLKWGSRDVSSSCGSACTILGYYDSLAGGSAGVSVVKARTSGLTIWAMSVEKPPKSLAELVIAPIDGGSALPKPPRAPETPQ